jgi:hypothetical protein
MLSEPLRVDVAGEILCAPLQLAVVKATRLGAGRVAARARRLACRRGMSGHAAVELLSVLTRLPPPQRFSPVAALRLEEKNFPEFGYLSETETRNLGLVMN